jgi:cell division protein FtsA
VQSITRAVREAEVSAGCEIHSVFTGISGANVKGFNSHGVVGVRHGEVSQTDLDRVLDAARAVALPLDRQIVHVLPQQFVIDGQEGVKEPVGMAGVRLEARVHLVTAAIPLVQNVMKCCQRAGLHVSNLILTPLASAEAVLGSEEKDLGVTLVDFGAGTTDVLVFHRGALVHTYVIPYGSYNASNDLAEGLRTPFREAELLKRRHGCARVRDVPPDEEIEVPSVGGRSARMMRRRQMCDIIEARVDEIFRLVQEQLSKAGFEKGLACGVVITGGGARLDGCAALAEQELGMPVRLGAPISVNGVAEVTSGPEFAAAVGLIVLGMRPPDVDVPLVSDRGNGRISQVVGWLREFF